VLATIVVAQLTSLVLLGLLPPAAPTGLALASIAEDIRSGDGRLLLAWTGPAPPLADEGERAAARLIEQRLAVELGVDPGRVRLDLDPAQGGQLVFAGPPGDDRQSLVLIGHFRVGIQQTDGGWRHHEPRERPRFDSRERRFLLLFLLSALLMLPVVWWFARRLAEPFRQFAEAAERMGRDPASPPPPIEGPEEVERAARAFHDMQARLAAFVDDRTRMVGAIAHDLRTPLTRLAFRAETLEGQSGDAIRGDIAEMRAMVADSLAYVRGLAAPAPRRRLELGALVEQVASDLAMTGRRVEARSDMPAVVEGDPVALRRLIANLLENGEAYGGAAHARVFAEDRLAVVEVTDDGVGPPVDDLERLFEPFVRGEPSRSRHTGGTGLGLSVARSIARAHGGDVALTRGAEGGLVARVTLPLLG
jgi:signal transduction histidine kinase